MYTLDSIHRYGYAPIGNVKQMIVEAIAQLVTVGKDRYEIADILGISYLQVETYAKQNSITLPRKKISRLLDDKTVAEYRELSNSHSLQEIAKIWGVSEPTLKKWRAANGLTFRKGVAH